MADASPHMDVEKALDDYQVALAIKGDRRAFALLYKRWHPKLLRLAYRLTQNRDEAQDVMQDAAMTIAKNMGKLDAPAKFSAWAYTIVRRRAADHIAKAVKGRKLQSRAADYTPKSESQDMDQAVSLKQALERLEGAERTLLKLFYIDGMSGAEIAIALGVPLGTVKSRLFTVRTKLQRIYTQTL